jgi:rhodanese-related sulfurtransferase
MAVAIGTLGFTNIKIYNGGLKDWQISGFTTETLEPLPDYETKIATAEELYVYVTRAEKNGCIQANGKPVFTLLDIRNDSCMDTDTVVVSIPNRCETIMGSLDDLQNESFREKIPKDTPVFVLTETGNRDVFAIRYLYTFGYSNVSGLKFGLRGWIMANFPTAPQNCK